MKIGKYPTQEEIKDLLLYDSLTGVFIWKTRPLNHFKKTKWQKRVCDMWNIKYAGKEAGRDNGTGYYVMRINNRTLMASRLAYIYVHGNIDDFEIDHINRNRADNRIANLRLSTRNDNTRNTSLSKNNKSGVVGVCFNNSHGLWVASIANNGKKIEVGSAKHFKKAVEYRYLAEIRYGYSTVNPHSTAYQYLQEVAS